MQDKDKQVVCLPPVHNPISLTVNQIEFLGILAGTPVRSYSRPLSRVSRPRVLKAPAQPGLASSAWSTESRHVAYLPLMLIICQTGFLIGQDGLDELLPGS